ncbi:Translation factor GUF1-like protein, mitochondrial [Frankliniella fusca]|uniref:Translation factor GUF1-like protein, mitochondrial n=1 Tax=Frankliniella fusca TaxID=407009 RepID=A0AAE1LTZ0_9NEOP|nr:Translation factor GUF1-like protein, mitochondrial [Frankliniella fusca]
MLFDIAHQNALDMIQIQEDIDFLLAQREVGRRGCMALRDGNLARKLRRKLANATKAAERRQRLQNAERRALENALQLMNVPSVPDVDENDNNVNEPVDTEYAEPVSSLGAPKRKRAVLSPFLLQMFDRAKVSCRKGAALVLTAHGKESENVVMSKSTLHRAREEGAKLDAELVNTDVIGTRAALHWDGKLLPDVDGDEKVDRLPVLLTGNGREILLGVPKISAGTGLQQAIAMIPKVASAFTLDLEVKHGDPFPSIPRAIRITDHLLKKMEDFILRLVNATERPQVEERIRSAETGFLIALYLFLGAEGLGQ